MNAPTSSYGLGVVHKISSLKESGLWGWVDQAATWVFVLFTIFIAYFNDFFSPKMDKTRISSFRKIADFLDQFRFFKPVFDYNTKILRCQRHLKLCE